MLKLYVTCVVCCPLDLQLSKHTNQRIRFKRGELDTDCF